MDDNYIKPRTIPENVTDSGRILNGLVRTRNLIEGAILAILPVFLVLRVIHFESVTNQIIAVILAGGFPIFVSLVLPVYSPFEFLFIFIHYLRRKHYAKYNPRLKWEKLPDYLINRTIFNPFEWITDIYKRLSGSRHEGEPDINVNIINPTHDEQFIEDRKYLEQHDLVPKELKSSSQLKAERREQKRREKEQRKEQNRLIKEAKKREKEERKASRSKQFIAEEQKGDDHAAV